jgi:hypothetical protein
LDETAPRRESGNLVRTPKTPANDQRQTTNDAAPKTDDRRPIVRYAII